MTSASEALSRECSHNYKGLKKNIGMGVGWHMPEIPVFRRQEDVKSKTTLGIIVRP